MLGRARDLASCVATVMLGTALGATASPVWAAPPSEDDLEHEPEPDALELVAQGSAKFEAADYDGAIELWMQAHELLPAQDRGELEVYLAHAHIGAYSIDQDERHLRQAKVLFSDYLAISHPQDEVRAEIEAELVEIDDELERLAREQAERDRIAREQTVHEQATEPEPEPEPAVPVWTERDQRRVRVRTAIGGTVAGLGVVSLAAMVAGLVGGRVVESRGNELFADADDPLELEAEFDALVERGTTYNRMAVAGGIVGGVLLLAGTSAIVAAQRSRHRHEERSEDRGEHRVAVGPAGLELHF